MKSSSKTSPKHLRRSISIVMPEFLMITSISVEVQGSFCSTERKKVTFSQLDCKYISEVEQEAVCMICSVMMEISGDSRYHQLQTENTLGGHVQGAFHASLSCCFYFQEAARQTGCHNAGSFFRAENKCLRGREIGQKARQTKKVY